MLHAVSPQQYADRVAGLRRHVRELSDYFGSRAQMDGDRDTVARIRSAFPDAVREWAVPGVPTTLLLGEKHWPQGWRPSDLAAISRSAVTCQDGVLWGCFQWNWQPSAICLFGVDLPSRRLTAFYVAPLPESLVVWDGQRGLVPGRDATYVAVGGLGLLKFPGTAVQGVALLKTPPVLGTPEGLPSTFVTGIAAHGEDLYLAYCDGRPTSGLVRRAETGIGIYDPRAGKWHALYCSTLAGNHPLSSGMSWEAHDLTTIGGRCLFCVTGGSNEVTGLWLLDDSGAAAQKVFGGVIDGSIVPSADGLMLRGGFFLANIDVGSQDLKLVLSRVMSEPGAWRATRRPLFPGAIFEPGESKGTRAVRDQVDLRSAVVYKDRPWYLVGQRIAVTDPATGSTAGLYPNNILEGHPAEVLVSTPDGVVAIGRGRVGIFEGAPDNPTDGRD